MELHFGSSTNTNHYAELSKLQQTTTVIDYQSHFEKVCNYIVGLTPDIILNCFISGLQPKICRELSVLSPYSISQVIGLAKLIEDKHPDSKPRPTVFLPPLTTHLTTNSLILSSNKSTINPHINHPLPIKCLTPNKLQERYTLGLCYNCDEKFTPKHRCTTSRFLLLLDNLGPTLEPIDNSPTNTECPKTIHFHLSPQALTGNTSPKTLKFTGLIHNLLVPILTDSGNSLNILQPRIAHHLHLLITPSPPLLVMVGNGAFIQCQGISPLVDISLQTFTFTTHFYLLSIEGTYVVLGIEWLCNLRPIEANFSIPNIAFTYQNQ